VKSLLSTIDTWHKTFDKEPLSRSSLELWQLAQPTRRSHRQHQWDCKICEYAARERYGEDAKPKHANMSTPDTDQVLEAAEAQEGALPLARGERRRRWSWLHENIMIGSVGGHGNRDGNSGRDTSDPCATTEP
jgi:hypothetical protein